MAKPSGRPIRDEVLAAACLAVQQVGVSSFSYGALAKELEISAPSIHHHFRTKDDLIGAVAARYRQQFNDSVDQIDEGTAAGRLTAYASLFDDTSRAELTCFCGSVAAEWRSVGQAARVEVAAFFDDQISWLAAQIEHGVERGEFRGDVDAAAMAPVFVASLEGALLVVRAGDDRCRPQAIAERLVDSLLNRDR